MHTPEQARQAKAFFAAKAEEKGKTPRTPILEAPVFWIAEDYHQKYYLRRYKPLIQRLVGEGWTDAALRDSTLAARANGWVAGHGTKEEIAEAVEAFDLDDEARTMLGRVLGRRAPATCGAAATD